MYTFLLGVNALSAGPTGDQFLWGADGAACVRRATTCIYYTVYRQNFYSVALCLCMNVYLPVALSAGPTGDQFLWGADGAECLCRIKHMSTRKYLTVRQDRGKYKVSIRCTYV